MLIAKRAVVAIRKVLNIGYSYFIDINFFQECVCKATKRHLCWVCRHTLAAIWIENVSSPRQKLGADFNIDFIFSNHIISLFLIRFCSFLKEKKQNLKAPIN